MILVLGTGRSGTSFVCHTLATELGIDFGDVPAPTRATPHGSYEDHAFYQLNHHRRAGLIGSRQWSRRLTGLAALRNGRFGSYRWGLKDPQAAPFTADLLDALGGAVVLWCDREPEACAISRCRFATRRPYSEWLSEIVAARAHIELGLEGRDYQRLHFDRRWTTAELLADVCGRWPEVEVPTC